MSQEKPMINIQNASTRMLRSPSHESISTEISLLSLSSLGPFVRIPSPIPDSRHRLTVPNAGEGGSKCPLDIWADEENDLIKNFGALFKFLGLPKSFSTSDINSTTNPGGGAAARSGGGGFASSICMLRKSSSELDLTQIRCNDVIFRTHFGPTSRSCSTWVAVGDVSSTSQLPSPQGRPHSLSHNGASFNPADLIRSVNKKIRQLYIRKRLLVAYRALERLSQSDFDLEKLPVVVPMNALSTMVRNPAAMSAALNSEVTVPVPSKADLDPLRLAPGYAASGTATGASTTTDGAAGSSSSKKVPKEIPLTLKDVERERGRPLSKFERNMMIFNWLHTLDETAYDSVAAE